MKKLSVILIIAIILSTLISNTFADSNRLYKTPENASKNISIYFKVGDEVLKINSREVKVVRPYVVNGNTLVPLRVISEAFGAEVVWEPKDNCVTITYSNVAIKLKLKSTEAEVNGQKVNIVGAPVDFNGTIMVPLRFITENFGADVSYNNLTKQIIIVKKIVGDNSIKDISLLLQRSTKKRIGDSYYNWSVELPEEFEIISRSYTGESNAFATPNKDKYLNILITDKTIETLDSIWENEAQLAMSAAEIILENKVVDTGDTQFERIVTRNYLGIYERRIYIEGNKIYTLELIIDDTSLKNTDKYKSYMDSFKPAFTDADTTEDLSDVDTNGYKIFNNKNLKFSFKVPLKWQRVDNKADNYISFYDTSNESLYNQMSFVMYSMGAVSSLDNWIAKENKFIEDEYNSSLVKLVSEEKININGYDCAILTRTLQLSNALIYWVDTLLVGNNYRYKLSISLSAEDYNKASYKAMQDYIIKSIKISEPSLEDISNLSDPMETLASKKLYKVMGYDNSWSFDVPQNWSRRSTSYPNIDYLYIDAYNQMAFKFFLTSDSPAKVVKWYEDAIKEAEITGSSKNISKEVFQEKGATVYKYTNSIIGINSTQSLYYYIIDRGNKTYIAYFLIDNIRKSDINQKLLDDLWSSITFY